MGNAKTQASLYLSPKPRNFNTTSKEVLSRDAMINAVKNGRPGTAMVGFTSTLKNEDIESVVDYIRNNLMDTEPEIVHYHTSENGWPDNDQFNSAIPFATGMITLEVPWEKLTQDQRDGKRIFLSSCITCHDVGVTNNTPIWEIRSVSYPRRHYSNKNPDVDAYSGASIHALHDQPVLEQSLTDLEKYGRQLFLDNCAFCHAPDGSARNWIGSFLEPRPRDFTSEGFIAGKSEKQLKHTINKGLPNTSMPAWESVLTEDQVTAIVAFLKAAF